MPHIAGIYVTSNNLITCGSQVIMLDSHQRETLRDQGSICYLCRDLIIMDDVSQRRQQGQ